MQRPISNKIQLGDMEASLLLTIKQIWKVYTVKLIKLEGFGNLVGQMKVWQDIPNLVPVSRQSQIRGSICRKAFASVNYSDMKILEFITELTANTYSNYSSMELVLPIQFTKKTQPKQHKWTLI